jgi:hypothetical protein
MQHNAEVGLFTKPSTLDRKRSLRTTEKVARLPVLLASEEPNSIAGENGRGNHYMPFGDKE